MRARSSGSAFRQSASVARMSWAGRPSSTMRMKAVLQLANATLSVEGRDAERRRLEELREADFLMRAATEIASRVTVDRGDGKAVISASGRGLDEQRQRRDASVGAGQIEIDAAARRRRSRRQVMPSSLAAIVARDVCEV